MINPVSSLSTASAPAAPATDPSLRKAAEGFEAVMLRQMIASMRKAKLAENELFGSSATDNFRELADAKTADSIASLGQFGIADMIEKQLSAKAGGHE